jgi:phosphate transport system protein
LVVSQVRSAFTAFNRRDLALAAKVVDQDADVDRLEAKADDTVSGILARRAPVANDLRFVMAASKNVAELERIGDEAAKIASLVPFTIAVEASHSPDTLTFDVRRMGDLALDSLQLVVGIFDVWNEATARKVIENHREMEKAFETILRRLMERTVDDSCDVSLAMSLVLSIKALERIGHSTRNMTESVMLQVTGKFSHDRSP